MIFNLFKKKNARDQYLTDVAELLHSALKPALVIAQAQELAAECLTDLRRMISTGALQDGPDPQPDVMAYFSLCLMVHQTSGTDSKQNIFNVSIIARVLSRQLKDQKGFTPLEKGIVEFGEHVLAEGISQHNEGDVSKFKSGAVSLIMDLLREHDATPSLNEIQTLVDNVSRNVGEREIVNVGEKILAMSSLTNVTGYAIDQGDIRMANIYFKCVMTASAKHFNAKENPLTPRQQGALRTIMQEYKPIVQELQAANSSFNNN